MDCFYNRVERDELLSPYFPGGVSEEHRAHVSTWCLSIAPDERHRFVSLLSFAADDAGLPDDPESHFAQIAYAEWGSRHAMHNSQPDAQVVEHVPRRGWGEAPPFQP